MNIQNARKSKHYIIKQHQLYFVHDMSEVSLANNKTFTYTWIKKESDHLEQINRSNYGSINGTIAFFVYFFFHFIGLSASKLYQWIVFHSLWTETILQLNQNKNFFEQSIGSYSPNSNSISLHIVCKNKSYSNGMNPIRSHAVCLFLLKIAIFSIRS